LSLLVRGVRIGIFRCALVDACENVDVRGVPTGDHRVPLLDGSGQKVAVRHMRDKDPAIAAWKAYNSAQGGGPARVEANERVYDGLRKAGMPEE
jgi:hypothetical protein